MSNEKKNLIERLIDTITSAVSLNLLDKQLEATSAPAVNNKTLPIKVSWVFTHPIRLIKHLFLNNPVLFGVIAFVVMICVLLGLSVIGEADIAGILLIVMILVIVGFALKPKDPDQFDRDSSVNGSSKPGDPRQVDVPNKKKKQ